MPLKDEFLEDVSITKYEDLDSVVENYLISRSNWFFNNSKYDEYKLKQKIKEIFDIEINNIFIVGSSQLGFSITPSGYRKYEFCDFRDISDDNKEESDIDVAIISDEIFENELKKLNDFLENYNKKSINEKFDGIARGQDKNFRKVYFQDYSTYLLKGWLRADKMPHGYYLYRDGIDSELNELRKYYNRKVNIGVYKSLYYLKQYHLKNIENIKQYITLEQKKETECQ